MRSFPDHPSAPVGQQVSDTVLIAAAFVKLLCHVIRRVRRREDGPSWRRFGFASGFCGASLGLGFVVAVGRGGVEILAHGAPANRANRCAWVRSPWRHNKRQVSIVTN